MPKLVCWGGPADGLAVGRGGHGMLHRFIDVATGRGYTLPGPGRVLYRYDQQEEAWVWAGFDGRLCCHCGRVVDGSWPGDKLCDACGRGLDDARR